MTFFLSGDFQGENLKKKKKNDFAFFTIFTFINLTPEPAFATSSVTKIATRYRMVPPPLKFVPFDLNNEEMQ